MAITELATTPWIPEDSFGTRLIQVRKRLGMTQAEIAQACDLDDGSWSNWENGSRPRGMDEVVRKIAENLNVDRDWLMWGSPDERCPSCGEARSRCFAPNPQLHGQGQLRLVLAKPTPPMVYIPADTAA